VMLQITGQMLAAVEKSRAAIEISRAGDAENGAAAGLLDVYGNALAAVGRFADATTAVDESLGKWRTAGSPRRRIISLGYAITLACESGDVERAERLLQEANTVIESDRTRYSRAIIDAAAARLALAGGDAPRAVMLARRALEAFEAEPPGARRVMERILLARSLNAAGEVAEAAHVAETAVQAAREHAHGLPHSYDIGQALLESAAAKAALGDRAAAAVAVAAALDDLYPTVGAQSAATRRAEQLRGNLEQR